MRRAHTCLWGWRIRTYGGGAYVPVKLCQAFSPQSGVWESIPHLCGMGLKYTGLSALVPMRANPFGVLSC